MPPISQLESLLHGPAPILALAPMQDITDLPFLKLIRRYGGADLYFTEYFRVYAGSHLNRATLRSITENPTGQPVIAQLIGNDIPELVRTARALQDHGAPGIDLNLGCPAPVVYRKCAGGGLLRDPELINRILAALRSVIEVKFTVKTRLGFASPAEFETLLQVFSRHPLDLLTIHGRTVAEQYRAAVHDDAFTLAANRLPYPVLANGNIASAARGVRLLAKTGAKGLMIGRGAIRNPWLFAQTRQLLANQPLEFPSGKEVLSYIMELKEALRPDSRGERALVTRLKKHLNFLGLGVEGSGQFLHGMRRVTSEAELDALCRTWLNHDTAMPLEPYDIALTDRDVLAGVHQ